MNKVTLFGRVGRDPEVKYLPNGSAMCKFSIATTEFFTKDGTKMEKTEWHNIVVWGKSAENAGKIITKGAQVLIDGKLSYSEWEKDGVKRKNTDIIANSWFIAGNKKSAATDPNSESDEDIPF